MKILHISTDNKFVEHAYTVFEIAFPKKNEVWVFSKTSTLNFVTINSARVILVNFLNRWTPKVAKKYYQDYDLVFIHSLNDFLYPEIFNIPKRIPIIWLGWGYDYYDFLIKKDSLLLPETRKIAYKNYKLRVRLIINNNAGFFLKILGIYKPKEKAVKRLSFFSPVLPNEYEMVRQARKWQSFPEHVLWNYGALEEHFIKGYEDEQVHDNAILIGNSASHTCNHKEILDFLYKSGFLNRQIIVPLSYGDKDYGEKIVAIGSQYFGERFKSLKDFMKVQDYVAIIKQCGYVIMNHKRQQAIGNIVIMLYFGARVFLREENPAYSFFKDLGIAITSVQELEKKISLLDEPLSIKDKEKNKHLVSEYWSRDKGVFRTIELVQRAMNHRNNISCKPRGNM